eukprot:6196691-Pleurochrysis_carterae.AAC.2
MTWSWYDNLPRDAVSVGAATKQARSKLRMVLLEKGEDVPPTQLTQRTQQCDMSHLPMASLAQPSRSEPELMQAPFPQIEAAAEPLAQKQKVPRQYQTESCEAAIGENKIVNIHTGKGTANPARSAQIAAVTRRQLSLLS